MYVLVSLLGVLFLLVYVYPDESKLTPEQRTQERLCYFFIGVVMIFFCGLRTKYNDTHAYVGAYIGGDEAHSVYEFLLYGKKTLGDNPGFHFLNALMKQLHFDSHLFLFTYAAFDVGVALWFIKKYARNLALGVFFFMVASYVFMFAGIKQATSASMALIGVHLFFQGYWLWYVVFLALAASIHPYILMLVLVPVFCKIRPWSFFTYVCIVCFGVLGIHLIQFASMLSNMAQMMGDAFTQEEVMMGRGVNSFRFLAFAASFVLSFIFRRELFPVRDDQRRVFDMEPVRSHLTASEPARKKCGILRMAMKLWGKHDSLSPEQIVNVYFHLSLLGCMFMFMAQFGNQILIGRLPHYVSAMRCLEMSYLFAWLHKKKTGKYRLCFNIGMICYVAFFVFEHMLNKNFGRRYDCIGMEQFITSFMKILEL